MKEDKPGSGKCGSPTKSGGYCKRAPVPGRTRCKFHGGATLKGAAHPNFKHGRYSKHLPSRLAVQYQEALSDPELLSSRDEIALLQSRIGELIKRLSTAESGKVWSKLRDTFDALKLAMQIQDGDLIGAHLKTLGRLIAEGNRDEAQWRELSDIIDRKTRIAQVEWKRLIEMQQTMTAEQVVLLFSSLFDAINRIVQDRKQLGLIGESFSAIMAGRQPYLPKSLAAASSVAPPAGVDDGDKDEAANGSGDDEPGPATVAGIPSPPELRDLPKRPPSD